eukprot:745930-Hanusia_phi.AAC.4
MLQPDTSKAPTGRRKQYQKTMETALHRAQDNKSIRNKTTLRLSSGKHHIEEGRPDVQDRTHRQQE